MPQASTASLTFDIGLAIIMAFHGIPTLVIVNIAFSSVYRAGQTELASSDSS